MLAPQNFMCTKVMKSSTLLIHFGVHAGNDMTISREVPPQVLRIISATKTATIRSP